MNSFNQILYNNGVLTINGTPYYIQATGDSVTGTSFSQLSLSGNVLSIDGMDITLTEYISTYLFDYENNQLLDVDDKELQYGDGVENASLLTTNNNEVLNDRYGVPLEFS